MVYLLAFVFFDLVYIRYGVFRQRRPIDNAASLPEDWARESVDMYARHSSACHMLLYTI